MEPDQSIPTNVSCPPGVHRYLLKLCVEKDAAKRCGAVDEGYDTGLLRVVYLVRHGALNHRESRIKDRHWPGAPDLPMKSRDVGEAQLMKRMVNEVNSSTL